MEEASRNVNQRYEMEEEAGEIQSEKATPSTIAGFNDGGRGHKPMQAASRSWENPQLARKLKLNYANRVSEQGNRLFPRAARNECTSFHFSMVTSDYKTIK